MTETLQILISHLLSVFGVTLSDQPWIIVSGVLIGAYFLSHVVKWGGHLFLDRAGHGPDESFNRVLFEEIHPPLYGTFAISGVYLSLPVLDIVESSNSLIGLFLTFLIIAILWVRAIVRLGNQWIELGNGGENKYGFSSVFKNLWTIFVVTGTGILLLSIWGVNITPFLAAVGIFGIVLGFAARDEIGNLIGGVTLYFDQTYDVGDVILLEDGQRGTVTDIEIRSTTILTPDNIRVTVPNSVLNSASVVNESTPKCRKRIRIPITTAYGTDYQDVERILLKVCDEVALVLDSPAPRVIFREFGDSTHIFELQAFVADPFDERRAIDRINRRIYDNFNMSEIGVPFPQQELSLLDNEADSLTEHRPSQTDRKRN